MQECDRCGQETRSTSMSFFNRDILCRQCKSDEREAPGYASAKAEEERYVRAGNYNYGGVGLSAADCAFLAEKVRARVPEAAP